MSRARLRKVLLPIAAILAPLLAAPAGAQNPDRARSAKLVSFPLPPFESFDKDGSGAIDRDEARDCRSLWTVFEELDLDDDHELDAPEYSDFSAIWVERAETFGIYG